MDPRKSGLYGYFTHMRSRAQTMTNSSHDVIAGALGRSAFDLQPVPFGRFAA